MNPALVERFAHESGPALKAYLQRQVRDPHVAEDLAQQALLRALTAKRDVPSMTDFQRYVYVIARNLVTDRARECWTRYVDRNFDITERPETVASVEIDDVATENGFEEIIALATPMQQTAFRLRYLEDLTEEQAARRPGFTHAHTKSLLHRGRERIRRGLRGRILHG